MDVRSVEVNGRAYRWPEEPVVVVCLDGSAVEYIDRAIAAGAASFLQSVVDSGFFELVDSALPSFTNPNNISIVTGVPPSIHGIGGNFFLDLSALDAPLRSHGGRAEQRVPMLANRTAVAGYRPRHNYDAFDLALNGCCRS
jgi:hypothetical protein